MGVYLSTPQTEKVTEDGENEMLRYGLSSMQGWRSTMEDAHAAHSKLDASTSFFGVYDGHGGKDVAKFCAKHLHEKFLEYAQDGDIETSVRKAFLRMDEMMYEIPGQILLASEGPTSGCTACVAIIRENSIHVANAGDSRCVLSRKGQAMDLSKDHKPNLADEKQRITEAGGFISFGRVNGCLNLSRAIGDMEMKRNKTLTPDKQIITANPDITTVELSDDDEFLIIACDGIWDCMKSQEAVDFVQEQLNSESNLSLVCGKVLDRCLSPASGGEGCDNMTMILIQFKRPSNRKPSSCDPEQETGSSSQQSSDISIAS